MSYSFSGLWSPTGFIADNLDGWKEAKRSVLGKRVVLTIEAEQEHRTSQANRYWRGVVVEFFREVWSQQYRRPANLPDYTNDDAHDALVELLAGFEDGPLGTRIRKRTRDMKKGEFYQLTEAAKELAWHQYQARIPEPNEEPA